MKYFPSIKEAKSKVIIEGLISDWPAFSDPTRTWRGDRWDSFMDEVDPWMVVFVGDVLLFTVVNHHEKPPFGCFQK